MTEVWYGFLTRLSSEDAIGSQRNFEPGQGRPEFSNQNLEMVRLRETYFYGSHEHLTSIFVGACHKCVFLGEHYAFNLQFWSKWQATKKATFNSHLLPIFAD